MGPTGLFNLAHATELKAMILKKNSKKPVRIRNDTKLIYIRFVGFEKDFHSHRPLLWFMIFYRSCQNRPILSAKNDGQPDGRDCS